MLISHFFSLPGRNKDSLVKGFEGIRSPRITTGMPNPLVQEARRRPERRDRTLDQQKGPGLTWASVVGSVDAILGVGWGGSSAFFQSPQGPRGR